MAFDILLAIRWPLKHHILLNRKTAIIIIICAWVLAVILSFAYCKFYYKTLFQTLAHTHEYEGEVNKQTFDLFCESWMLIITTASGDGELLHKVYKTYFTVSFLIIAVAFLTILLMYCYIIAIAIRARKTKQHYQRHSITSQGKNRSAQMALSQTKAVGTTILLLSAYIILWMPLVVYFGLILTESRILPSDHRCLETIERILMVSICCTAIVDIGIYFIRSKEAFRVLKCFNPKKMVQGS